MKKIYINARFLTQQITGVQRYAIELVKAMDALLDNPNFDMNIILLVPVRPMYKLGLKNISIQTVGKLTGHMWEQLELAYYSRGGLLLNLCNTGPMLKQNQVVAIHDASVYGFPGAYSLLFRCWYKVLFTLFGRFSKAILTVSGFSKQELIKYCQIPAEKIYVSYEGKEQILGLTPDNSIIERHGLNKRSFILAVSSLNPNKNFSAIVKAVELMDDGDFDIAIAGGGNSKIFSNVVVKASERVKCLGYVTDQELKALYKQAACFVYPSFYEGFGLPPLEAMACGCPVIVSHTASLPEVCGIAALYCNPASPEDIANKIRMVMNNASLRQELKAKGIANAQRFSWERCALDVVKMIERIYCR